MSVITAEKSVGSRGRDKLLVRLARPRTALGDSDARLELGSQLLPSSVGARIDSAVRSRCLDCCGS